VELQELDETHLEGRTERATQLLELPVTDSADDDMAVQALRASLVLESNLRICRSSLSFFYMCVCNIMYKAIMNK